MVPVADDTRVGRRGVAREHVDACGFCAAACTALGSTASRVACTVAALGAARAIAAAARAAT